jgi:hypothetical protein
MNFPSPKASYLASRRHVQASGSRVFPGRPPCEGDHLSRCQEEDGESNQSVNRYNELINHKKSTGQIAPCLVADTMDSMNGFENKAVETAIKEAASTAFAGIYADSMTVFARCLFVFLCFQGQMKQ